MASAPRVHRRISYVIPAPSNPPQKLLLPSLDTPRRGRTIPLLIPDNAPVQVEIRDDPSPGVSRHPQHRLGVSALAVDSATLIAGKSTPEGILYSAGRDGLVIAWEIGVPMKPRPRQSKYRGGNRKGDWNAMTGWDDEDDEDISEDGSAAGDSESSDNVKYGSYMDGMDEPLLGPISTTQRVDPSRPYEHRWEVDTDDLNGHEQRSSFRQCVQAHGDWVNDMVLCNSNQTLISASNDGTVKSWSPHDPSSAMMATHIGKHMDYVRCLAHSPKQSWVASGSFDRTIKLWDISRPASSTTTLGSGPITTLSLPEPSSKASVYALATTPTGSLIASGSPERVIRMWDHRTGKRTGKLVGHTDNIRSILISDDGKYLLSGSSDASVKIWSLSAQRCLHTFSHHTDSVWSLFSSHPSLSVFYSGDRSGLVCKVDMENCGDVSEGECVVLCRDSPFDGSRTKSKEGINKLVALDDWAVWTATGSSDIKRWRDPGRRSKRMAGDEFVGAWDKDLSAQDTFGFTPLNNTHSISRSPTPIATLLRTDSRHSSKADSPPLQASSSLVFAPSASRRDSGSSLPSKKTDNPVNYSPTSTRKQPRKSMQSIAPSIITLPDEHRPDQGPDSTLFGIPFDSLVKFVSPHRGYSNGGAFLLTTHRARDPEVATLYSAASVLSVPVHYRAPHHPVTPTHHDPAKRSPFQSAMQQTSRDGGLPIVSPSVSSSHFIMSTDQPTGGITPQAAFDERELAADAIPLRQEPEEIIHGSYGLVRSVILNDRIHALTVDTANKVKLWDLVRGVCRGYYDSEDVENASLTGSVKNSHGGGSGSAEWSPRESLETVRERIEGEAMIASWATVDTKVGNLTVHMSEGTCFDAEVYADEAGFSDPSVFQDEQRFNIGKWVLGNLFSGFIHAELQAAASNSFRAEDLRLPNPVTPGGKGIHRAPAPGHISLDGLKTRRLRSNSDLTVVAGQKTPGISLTTAAMTPAIVPEVPAFAFPPSTPVSSPPRNGFFTGPLTTIPASPNPVGSPTPRGHPMEPPPVSTPTAGKNVGHADYFSARSKPDTADAVADGMMSPKVLDTPGPLATPSTPSGRLMGRLRNFGKSTKRSTAPDEVASSTAIQEDPEEEETEEARITRVHLEFLDTLLSQRLQPPSNLDVPPIDFPPETAILIAEQQSGESRWTPLYLGTVSSTNEDVDAIEVTSPIWLLEYLLTNKAVQATTVKLSFMVTPWNRGDAEPLPELLTNQARLTASRVLRVRKILIYVMDKLDALEKGREPDDSPPATKPDGETDSGGNTSDSGAQSQLQHLATSPSQSGMHLRSSTGSRPEDAFEILCNDVVLPVNMTLAAVRHYVWRQGGELVMQYRRKVVGEAQAL